MKLTKLYSRYLLSASLALAGLDSAHPQTFTTVVAPTGLANTEGNSFGYLPFDFPSSGRRFQQVFDASQFSAIAGGGGYITALGYRLDSRCQGAEGQTIPSFQIDLSTTSKGPDSLSPVFAENVGPDDMVVRGPSQVFLLGGCASGMPQSFTAFVSLDHPFFYNPRTGNLLLDIRNY